VIEGGRYFDQVPDARAFSEERSIWRQEMAEDRGLQDQARLLLHQALGRKYNYQWEWCGTPVIRTPEDMCLLQEMIWDIQPAGVVEAGVARGGGLILSASLMAGMGLRPRVLGIDIAIHPHAQSAIAASPWAHAIELLCGDSAGPEANQATADFVTKGGDRPIILTLDSDHSHDHVLAELRVLGPLLPLGSLIIVADTVIAELPESHSQGRPWGAENNPATAVREFLAENRDFRACRRWAGRALITENREGIIERVSRSGTS